MKLVLADDKWEIRYRVQWANGSMLARDFAQAESIAAGKGGGAKVVREETEQKGRFVIVVSNGEPNVFGTYATARTANAAATRYGKRHPGTGVIRVLPLRPLPSKGQTPRQSDDGPRDLKELLRF